MNKVKKLLIFALIIPFFANAQINNDQKLTQKIEDFIIAQKLDSALYYINKNTDNQYFEKLKQLIESDLKSLPLNRYFLGKINFRFVNNYQLVSDYIDKNVKLPNDTKNINNDYVKIKWRQLSFLINDRLIEESNLVYKALEKYVSRFNNKNRDVKLAKLRLKTYPLGYLIIKEKVQEGKKQANEFIEEAKQLNSTELEVIFTQYLLGFFVSERNVDAYIETSEKILDKAASLDDQYEYNFLLSRLVNAYIFKQGYEKKCLKLLEKLYLAEETRNNTYLYYVQLIHTNIKNKKLVNHILTKFKTKSVLEFINKIKPICKSKLIDIDYLAFIDQASTALEYNGNFQEAINLKNEQISLNKEIYSNQLSESLAQQKTEQALKIKEKEIEIEKEQTKLYLIIALLCFFLLIISFISIKKLKRQSEQLTDKNILINKSLDEKELLIREMHHRVKNNFQLITSLLDLQTEEVEDNDVKAIFEKGKSRIKSMSLIHQKLYGTDSGLIKFDDFIRLLVRELSFLYKCDENLKLDINVKEFYFDVDTAIPLSLILNELITNAFKYAFKNSMDNVLHISLEKTPDNHYLLVFKDNGIGIPEGFNKIATKGAGLKLVSRLVRQLQGKLKLINDSGAKFEILFKDTKERKKTV